MENLANFIFQTDHVRHLCQVLQMQILFKQGGSRTTSAPAFAVNIFCEV